MLRLGKLLYKKIFCGGSRGFTLIEVVVAIVVLGLITASVIPTLLIINKAEFRRDEQRIAESLTRNQLEYIKSVPYVKADAENPNPEYSLVPAPDASYEIQLLVKPIEIVTIVPSPPATPYQEHNYLPTGQDEGIQEITVRIYHVDKMVLETRDYKVDRL